MNSKSGRIARWAKLNAVNEVKDEGLKVKDVFFTVDIKKDAAATTGVQQTVNSLVQGDDYQERIGTEVQWHTMWINVAFTTNVGVAQTNIDLARVLIVLDHQPNPGGTMPSWQDVITDTQGNSDSTTWQNWQNRHRFTILEDILYQLPPTSGTTANWGNINISGTENSNMIRKRIDLRGLTTTWFQASGFIATNAIYVMWQGQILAASNPAYKIHCRTRLTYNE